MLSTADTDKRFETMKSNELYLSDDSIKHAIEFANNQLKIACSNSIKQLVDETFIEAIKPIMTKIQNTSLNKIDFTEKGRNNKWENELYGHGKVHKDAMKNLNLLNNEFVIDFQTYGDTSSVWCIGITNMGRIFKTSPKTHEGDNISIKLEGEPIPLNNEYIDLITNLQPVYGSYHLFFEHHPLYYTNLVEIYRKYHPIASDIYHNENKLKKINDELNKIDSNKKAMEKMEKDLELRNRKIIKEEQLLKERILNVSKRELELERISNITKREKELDIKMDELKCIADKLLNSIDTAECELGINDTSISRASVKHILLNLENI